MINKSTMVGLIAKSDFFQASFVMSKAVTDGVAQNKNNNNNKYLMIDG